MKLVLCFSFILSTGLVEESIKHTATERGREVGGIERERVKGRGGEDEEKWWTIPITLSVINLQNCVVHLQFNGPWEGTVQDLGFSILLWLMWRAKRCPPMHLVDIFFVTLWLCACKFGASWSRSCWSVHVRVFEVGMGRFSESPSKVTSTTLCISQCGFASALCFHSHWPFSHCITWASEALTTPAPKPPPCDGQRTLWSCIDCLLSLCSWFDKDLTEWMMDGGRIGLNCGYLDNDR